MIGHGPYAEPIRSRLTSVDWRLLTGGGADGNGNGIVDAADLNIWEGTYPQPTEPRRPVLLDRRGAAR